MLAGGTFCDADAEAKGGVSRGLVSLFGEDAAASLRDLSREVSASSRVGVFFLSITSTLILFGMTG